jgi:hypothetical protein
VQMPASIHLCWSNPLHDPKSAGTRRISLKGKATGSFDKLVTCYQTTRFHISEDNNI